MKTSLKRRFLICLLFGCWTATAQTPEEKMRRVKKWMKSFDDVVDEAVELGVKDQAIVLVALRLATLANATEGLVGICKPIVDAADEADKRRRISS